MKKAITILAILAIVVGAVFATNETHTLRVRADVTAVEPAIQLKLNVNEYKTNGTPNEYYQAVREEVEGVPTLVPTQHNYTDYATNNNAFDTGFNLDQQGSVTAYAYLANYAKTNKIYTLSFSDGEFSVKRHGNTETYGPSSITSSAGDSAATFYTTALGTAHVDPEDAESELLTNQDITVTFLGKTVETKDVILAQAVFAYPGDTTIDPTTSENPWYYANITLTVSTT